MDNPATRGRYFDYFIGLLFNQLPGVEVWIGREVSTGEVDVFITCLGAPDWLHRLVGEATLLENKWKKSPAETSDISIFHDKVKQATVSCKVAYFISMSGFTSERKMGAEQLLQAKRDPKMVGWTRNHVEKMIDEASPANLMKKSVL